VMKRVSVQRDHRGHSAGLQFHGSGISGMSHDHEYWLDHMRGTNNIGVHTQRVHYP
jgi:hypothetical protein